MSFFGLPQGPAHNSRMPGFGQAPDHFAALSSKTSGQLESDEGWVYEAPHGVKRELLRLCSDMTLRIHMMDLGMSWMKRTMI